MEPEMIDDRPHEECGVFGIHGHDDAAHVVFSGLFALQHRGQESAGIAVADGSRIRSHKGMGLVSEVFTQDKFNGLKGQIGLGHVRYSTTGTSLLSNAQPLAVRYRLGQLALAHNGNLVNAADMRLKLEEEGSIFQTTSDTELIAHLVAKASGHGIEESLVEALRQVRGAYALVAVTQDVLIGARDPMGIRPLSLGQVGDAYILASETCAIDSVGWHHIRDVNPGEIVFIDKTGLR